MQKNNNPQKQVNTEIPFPEIEISRLIDELQCLNKQNYQYLQIGLTNVYNILFEYQLTKKSRTHALQQTPDLLEQDLLALCQGVVKIFQYFPRPVQLISVILLFNHSQNKGRLAQIYTGEGKTLIVAMLAVLIAIKKKEVVDIITSSPVLAKRDAQELAKFYQHFGLTVSHNVDEKEKEESDSMLTCYQANIVYGDSHSFEGDILRHEYSEQGTKGDRKEGYAIVDEVDSMLIDGIAHQTFLSSPLPGMLDISKVLRLIWDEICKQEINLTKDKKKVIVYKENKVFHMDFQTYISEIIDFQIKKAIGYMILPYRLDYINFMKKTWIENAIYAKFYLQENHNYVIDKGQVRIVDFQNTGVIHKNNMTWQQGLHQFVQLKHDLNLTSLSISTNFMSNVCFFKRYKNKILGLTGTLGSQFTKELLSNQYGVDFVLIPPNKPRLLQELSGQAVKSEKEWLDEIYSDVNEQLLKQRAVLIINKTIKDVQNIEKVLQSDESKITVYTDDSQEIDKKIGKGEVIIATNLAGRGTDFITNEELEESGGLHVIVTFLPRNVRIQEQAFGRTARQGRKGTARLIVQLQQSFYLSKAQQLLAQIDLFQHYYNNLSTIKPHEINTLMVLKYYRDQNEKIHMDEMDQQMNELMNEDECFQTFCRIAKGKVDMKKEPALFKSLEEKWGLYLEQNKDKGLNKQDIEEIFREDGDLNPKYLIMQGLEKNKKDYLDEASKISNNDPAAIYYKGCFEIKKLTQSGLQSGVQTLLQAKQILQEKIDNENGCNLAFKLNRYYIQEFQPIDEQENLKLEEKKAKKLNLNAYEKQDIFEPLFEEMTVSNIKIEKKDYEQFETNQFQRQQAENNRPATATFNNQQKTNNQSSPYFQNLNQREKQFREQNNIDQNSFSTQSANQTKLNTENSLQSKQTEQTQKKDGSASKENCKDKKELTLSFDSKIKNQLRMYQKLIDSIDDIVQTVQNLNPKEEVLEFGWESTTENIKDVNLEMMQNEEWKDIQEVIHDGPFPKLGKLFKRKKETSWFSKFLMLFLGLIQIAAGFFVCACTAGTGVVLGSWLIEQGIADVSLAIKSFTKNIEIDWGQWGKNKVISLCTTLALAAPIVASQASTLAVSSLTMTIAGATDVYQNFNKNNFQEVQKAGDWLTTKEKKNLETQYDIIKQIGNQSDNCRSKQQIVMLAANILKKCKNNQTITEAISNEIENLVLFALEKGGVNQFKNTLRELSGGFLKMQMAKFKSNQDIQSLKQDLKEVGTRKGNQFQEKINSQMVWLKKNETQLKVSLTNFPKMAFDSIFRDTEIQKNMLCRDLFYEFCCKQDDTIQNSITLNFQQALNLLKQLHLKIKSSEIKQLDLNSQKSVDQFYYKNIRNIIQKCLSEIVSKNQKQEPLAILLNAELSNLIKTQVDQLQVQQQSLLNHMQNITYRSQKIKQSYYPNQYEIQTVKQMIDDAQNMQSAYQFQVEDLKNVINDKNEEICFQLILKLQSKGLIQNDGLSVFPQFQSEFNKLLYSNNFSSSLKQFLLVALQNAIKTANSVKQKSKKLFSGPFLQSVQCELLKPIENQIFQVKMDDLEAEVQARMKAQYII